MDPNLTDIACHGLNNMMLGEKKLVVQRASVGSTRSSNPAGGANAIALHPNLMLATNGATEVLPTNVLQLLNMVTPEELEDDQEFQGMIHTVIYISMFLYYKVLFTSTDIVTSLFSLSANRYHGRHWRRMLKVWTGS